MNKKLTLIICLYFFLLSGAFSQAKKINSEPMIWGDLQADYFLENQSFFFFKSQLRHSTEVDGLIDGGILDNLYQVYFQLGYDQKLTDHWRGGISARYTLDRFNDNQIYQAAMQHNGKIGKTDFIKRLAFDVMRFEEGESMGRFRPMMALERNFNFVLGGRIIRPHFSYELFFYNNFKEDDAQSETRTVDRSRFRLAAGFQITDKFWLTPYFTKQTEYYNALTTYTGEIDANGNQVVKEQGGKRNRIEPILGLELRFLLPGKNVSETTIPNLDRLTEVPVEKPTAIERL